MKKVFNSLFVVIAAMIAFTACVKEENAPADLTKTVQFFAESIETKSVFGTPDGTTYPTLWTENDEKVKVLLNLNEEAEGALSVSDDFKKATFNAEVSVKAEGGSVAPYTFYVMSPYAAYLSHNAERFSATIPTVQKPLEGSVDEAAQILYAISEEFDQIPESVVLNFKHFTAYGKLTLNNLELGDAKILSIDLTSEVDFAGRWNYMVADGSYAVNSGAKTITLETSKDKDIWFACAPVDVSGKNMKVTVNTDKGPINREFNFNSNCSFKAGKIASFSVDMEGCAIEEPVVYDLVTNAAELTPQSKIIIVAAGYDLAISTTQNNNNRAQAAVTKNEDNTISAGPAVQIITVENGTKSGTIAFNVGNGYLYAAASSSNYLRTELSLSDNSSWAVTIDEEGIATIKAQGANTKNWLRYNETSTIFSCYGSGQKDVVIYKQRGTGGALENYLIVSPTSIDVASTETSATFSVSSDLSWSTSASTGATVSKDGNNVTVSFEANNDSTPKIYTVEVSAAGAESQTVTITQAGKVVVDDSFEPGEYWIIAGDNAAIPGSGNYGYLNYEPVWKSGNSLVSTETNVFTIESAGTDGYYIKDSNGKYLYASTKSDGTYYTSFQFGENTTAALWSIVKNDNETYTITNIASQTYIQCSTSFKSFGHYSTEQSSALLPNLVKVGDVKAPAVEITSSLLFVAEGGEQTITLPVGVTATPTCNNSAFSVSSSDNLVTVVTTATNAAQSGTLSLVLTFSGYELTKTISLSQAAPASAGEVTDKITPSVIGISGTSYASWSGKTINSSAVYAGQSSAGTDIQLRSNNSNSGIITTTSGGSVKKIVVTWNSATASGRTLQIYGKSEAYSAPTDLYNSDKQGTLLGEIVKGSSTELVVDGNYEYIGLRSKSGAMYITDISITWSN